MLRWRYFAVLPVLWCAAAGEAAQVRVTVDPLKAECVAGGTIVATPERGKAISTAIVPERHAYVITVPDSQAMTIAAEHPRCWGDRAIWLPDDPREVIVALQPAAEISGTFGASGRTIRTVQAYLHRQTEERAEDADRAPQVAVSNSPCTVADGRWRCKVPAESMLDFRLEIPGFASQYYWDVSVRPNEVYEVEPQALVAGSSIAGWVVRGQEIPVPNARVSVYPRGAQGKNALHAPAQRQTRRSDRRGFFQFTGLPPGSYRVVSEAAGLSPALLPEVIARNGEAIALPQPLRHGLLAELEIVVEPPTDASGRRWNVELAEKTPLYAERRPRVISRHTDADGRWKAKALRADVYEITVHDGSGTVAHREPVDLFDGGPGVVALSVHQIPVNGRLLAGDDPLKASIHLANEAGNLVKITTDAEGRFEVALPAPGVWRPSVLYPPGRGAARIAAEPFVIPQEAPRDVPHQVVVRLEGGRIHGSVVSADRRKGPAVVHAYRGQSLVAEQRTDDEGRFDFVGMKPGTYWLDAQSGAGSTPRPVEEVLADGENLEVTLVTEPYVRLHGYVTTPDGRPASGAVVQFCADGIFWERMVADVHGRFGRDVGKGTDTVQLVVLAHGYPATMLATPLTADPVRVQLRNDGGVIRFGSPAVLMSRGARAPAHAFRFESAAPFSGRIYIESGSYMICPVTGAEGTCRTIAVGPSTEDEVEFKTPARTGGSA